MRRKKHPTSDKDCRVCINRSKLSSLVMSVHSILSLGNSLLVFGDSLLWLTFLTCSDGNLGWNSPFSMPGEKPFEIQKINSSSTLRKFNLSMIHLLNARKLHFGPVVSLLANFDSLFYHEQKTYWLV